MSRISGRGFKFATALVCVFYAATMPAAFAQAPVAASAVNSASFAQPGQPHGKLARGGIFSLFGALMSGGLAQATAFPLPTTLGGTEVEITVSGVTRSAILLFVSPGQINAILPSDVPAGQGSLRVLTNGQVSAPLAIDVANHSFGIYTLRSSGSGPGVVTDPLDSNSATAPNTALRSAHAGELWDLWGTGLTAIETSDAEAPPLVDRANLDVKVLVGDVEAQVVYRGRSPCCAGLDQIRFLVPAEIEGCCVLVQVVVEGVPSNVVTMSVANEGRICPSDVLGGLTEDFLDTLNGEAIAGGAISATRVQTLTTPTQGNVFEIASGYFVEYRISGLILDPCFNAVAGYAFPLGPCNVIRSDGTAITFDLDGNELGRFNWNAPANASVLARLNQTPAVSPDRLTQTALEQIRALGPVIKDQVGIRPLNPGPALTLEGPNGSWQLPLTGPGSYGAVLSNTNFNGQPQGVFRPGRYRFRAPGGPDVGAFAIDLPMSSPLEWTNKAQAFPEVLRHQPLRVEWDGGNSPFLVVTVRGSSISTTGGYSSSDFFCDIDYSRRGFTIPSPVLRMMIPTGPRGGVGTLQIRTEALQFAPVAGLDSVAVAYFDGTILSVRYGGEGEVVAVRTAGENVDPE